MDWSARGSWTGVRGALGLEIISPGGLPRGMTIPRMMSGCSRCRNKAIAEAFAYMHVAEKWGLGIPNVMQEFVEHGLTAPEYTDWGNAVKVTVRRIQRKLDIGLGKQPNHICLNCRHR